MSHRRPSPSVSTKVYVGNLPETIRKQDLQSLFEKYGKVAECDIVKNYAFVHFEDPDCAKVAVENLDNSDFQSSKLTVQLSHSKVRQKPGMGSQDECFRCGKTGHWSKDCPKSGYGGGSGYGGRRYDGGMGRGRDRGRGGPYRSYGGGRRDHDLEELLDEPYLDLDVYRERYSRDRFSPYDLLERRLAERRLMLARELQLLQQERDPYARPPPEFYRRGAGGPSLGVVGPPGRDPLFDLQRRFPSMPSSSSARGRSGNY